MSSGNLSASCLCYLFGDRFIKPLTWYERLTGIAAVDIPSSGRLVALGRLEREMLAIGLWSLHDSGDLALRYTKAIQPGRPLDFSQFRLELSADHTLGQSEACGVEGQLLSVLRGRRSDLYNLVCAHWLDYQFLPFNGVVVIAQREALVAGLVRSVSGRHPPRPMRWNEGHRRVVGNRKALDALNPAAADMANRLELYKRKNRDIWKRLVVECGRVLARARPAPVIDGGGGG